ncbi:MAG: hypothetical protein A3F13_03965 [Gammaproteobacteria bacterium RIFCSPHIGHO2_12_FULL_40_19]|nr:MAG: hypothetical protein A3F13_03965 [Gammaproteobacteria bacterium RIFCSPHIGHO2_12_FULL_40_19]
MESRHERQIVERLKQLKPELNKINKHKTGLTIFENTTMQPVSDVQLSASYLFIGENKYKVGQMLGKGAFGDVKIGFCLKSNEKVAIKIQNRSTQIEYHAKTLSSIEKASNYVTRQIGIEDDLLKLTGQYIASTSILSEKGVEKHYSVMKFIDGVKLKDIFNNLSYQDKLQCFIDIATQINFLHDQGYLHLDVWRENLLYSNGKAMLHDYGCAARLNEMGFFMCKLKGSHIPPEIYESYEKKERCLYREYSDVFALGMTFHELLHNDYHDYSADKSFDEFVDRYNEYYLKVLYSKKESQDILDKLIGRMICPNPIIRISIPNTINCLKLSKPISIENVSVEGNANANPSLRRN